MTNAVKGVVNETFKVLVTPSFSLIPPYPSCDLSSHKQSLKSTFEPEEEYDGATVLNAVKDVRLIYSHHVVSWLSLLMSTDSCEQHSRFSQLSQRGC